EALQIDTTRAHAHRYRHEAGNLFDVVPHYREPQRHPRPDGPALPLEVTQPLEVREHLVERVGPAHSDVGFASARVERDARLGGAGVDEGGGLCARQADRVRVEQDLRSSPDEMLDHAREVAIEQRLADAVQDHPFERGKLVDDLEEAWPGEVLGGLTS